MRKNQMLYGLVLSLILLPAAHAACATEAGPRIAWFCSSGKSGFWPVAERFVFAAAEDLGAKVQIYRYGDNPMMIVTEVEKVLADPNIRPDAILFHNYKGKGKEVLELCERFKVPAFVFNAGFSPGEKVGSPRSKYKYLIGLMVPDDEYAGFILAKKLMAEARKLNKRGSDGHIHLVALEGNRSSNASNARIRGLEKALEGSEFINLQYFHSKWQEQLASEVFKLSVIRYPDVSVFWCASDSMAVGVIKAAESQGWVPGKDFVAGGIDLLPRTQHYLESGELAASVGGQYAEGAWALIALYDYLMGFDFAPYEGTVFSTKMAAYTSSTFTELGDLSQKLSMENLQNIDFRHFSKAYTPGLKKYEFDLEALFK